MAAPTIPYTIPGTVNQDFPEMVCRISFASATTPDPLTWVDFSSRLRSFQIEQGSGNELEAIDTGTCTVVLDDRARDLDPFNTSSAYSPNVLPRRRLWLQSYWAGECKDQFYGWTGSFQPSWVQNADAVVTVEAEDGQSMLHRAPLPVSSPPRGTYRDLVMSENPAVYFPLNEPAGAVLIGDASGNGRSATGMQTPFTTATFQNLGLVVGDADTCVTLNTSSVFLLAAGDADMAGSGTVAMDGWVRVTATTGAGVPSVALIGVPCTGATGVQYYLSVEADKVVAKITTNTAGYSTTGTTTLAHNVPYHVGMRWDGTALKVYVNGVEDGTTATAGGALKAIDPASILPWTRLGGRDNNGAQHFAVYPSLTAARLLEHYRAGVRSLGIQDVTARLNSILDNATGFRYMPRRIRADASSIQQTYFGGQDALTEIQKTMPVAGEPAMFFLAKDGAVVFLDSGHRSTSPWDTVQATFDDDGTDLAYLDVDVDDGAQFIRNDVRGNVRPVTQTGLTQSSEDAASIAEYGRVVLDLGETLHQVEADLATEVANILVAVSTPEPRVTALHLEGSHNSGAVQSQIFNRELGDSVRVFPPAHGWGLSYRPVLLDPEAHPERRNGEPVGAGDLGFVLPEQLGFRRP